MKSKNTKKLIITIISIVLAVTLCLSAAGAVGVVAIGALAMGTVIVGGGIITAVIYNQPEYVAARALTGFADDLLSRNELKPIVQALNGGSVEFNVDNVTIDAEGEYTETLDTSLKGKFYFDEEEMMLKDFRFMQEDFMIGGDVYISDDEMYIKETEILQDAYGIKLSELANDLSNSVFAPYSGTEYALDEDTYQALVDISRIASRSDEMEEDAKKLSDKLTKDIWKIVTEHSEVTSENADVNLNGTYKSSRVISIRIDRRAMELIINNVYYYLRDSKEIYDFLYKYEDSFAPVFEDYYYERGYGSLAEAYRSEMWHAEYDVQSFSREIYNSEFRSIELKLTTPTMLFSTLRKLELYANDRQLLVLDCGAQGIKKSDTVSLRVPDALEAVYRVNENSDHRINATLDVNAYSDFSIKFFVDINKYEGTYAAGFEYPEYGYEDDPAIETDTNDRYDDEYEDEGEFESGSDILEEFPDQIEIEDTNETVVPDYEIKYPDTAIPSIDVEIPHYVEVETQATNETVVPDYEIKYPDTAIPSIDVEIPPYVEVETQATNDIPYYGEAVYKDDYVYEYDYNDGYVYDDGVYNEIIRDDHLGLDYASYVKFTVEGQLRTVNDTTTVTVDRIVYENDRDYFEIPDDDYNDVFVITVNSQFIIDTEDEMPEKIDYKTIDQITVIDIENLLSKIQKVF